MRGRDAGVGVAAAGNVGTETMRALDADQISDIIGRTG